ncbi:hypothetical protein K505DRAFT_342186 [Melanomma pulvis-pyrius CBS 109.77]|uniref:Uncharacterized protein n=1 Tax=Melanomma pulvis-pyrius CBS 109.77 TaxID=1314802 RepID=A0A6A6WW80_9PLEO|nr:hypothetical protein K505DRAFT_342186 [Melanomma pulvis-pyrius CBS 109.77]
MWSAMSPSSYNHFNIPADRKQDDASSYSTSLSENTAIPTPDSASASNAENVRVPVKESEASASILVTAMQPPSANFAISPTLQNVLALRPLAQRHEENRKVRPEALSTDPNVKALAAAVKDPLPPRSARISATNSHALGVDWNQPAPSSSTLTAGTRCLPDGKNITFEEFASLIPRPRAPINVNVVPRRPEKTHLSSLPSRQAFHSAPVPGPLLPDLGVVAPIAPTYANPYGVIGQRTAPTGSICEQESLYQQHQRSEPLRPRILLALPLRIARSQAGRDPMLAPIRKFLDRACPRESETVVSREPLLPNIVYTVAFNMNDEDWTSYCMILQVFELAGALQNVVGNDPNFNQLSSQGWLPQGGQELTELLGKLVRWFNLGLPWDKNKPWEKPGCLPPVPI